MSQAQVELKNMEYIIIHYKNKDDQRIGDAIADFSPEGLGDFEAINYCGKYIITVILFDNKAEQHIYYVIDNGDNGEQVFYIHDDQRYIESVILEIQVGIIDAVNNRFFRISSKTSKDGLIIHKQLDELTECNEQDNIEIEIDKKKYNIPVICKRNQNFIDIIVDSKVCMDALIKFIRENYQLKQEINLS